MGFNNRLLIPPSTTTPTSGDHFEVITYTGDGSNNRIITGTSFTPDLVWIKARNFQTNHMLQDSVRGASAYLQSDGTAAENSNTAFNWFRSFNNNGFTIGYQTTAGVATSQWNQNNITYVAWCWKAGGSAVSNTDGTVTSQVSADVDGGFSIVSYTGAGSGTVGHGLNVPPELIITKNRFNSSAVWATYSKTLGTDKLLDLNTNIAAQSISNYWGTSAPTSTVYGLSTNSAHYNANGAQIAYCFHSVAGYSKVGSYTGTGNNMTVNVGFEPSFVMIKNTTDAASWHIFDDKRTAANPSTGGLFPNETIVEADYNTVFEFTSTGFNNKVVSTSLNKLNSVYFYYAIAI
tara:strand:+ start:332 stop:1372 length:1041 start_codon:yes stop_codon:yes gene_type:complete